MKPSQILRRIVYHAILIALSIAFALPFLWMLSTSMKADDEVIHDPMVWIPEFPVAVKESPYQDPEAHPPRWRKPPSFPETHDWEEFTERLQNALWFRAEDLFQSSDWPMKKDSIEPALFTRAKRDILDFLWESLRQRVPETDWNKGSAIALITARVTLDDVVRAWNKSYRYIAFQAVHLRNSEARDIGVFRLEIPERLPYRIRDRNRIELYSARIDLTSPEETIDHIMLRFKGDESFHRLGARFEYDGKVYDTESPAYLDLRDYQDLFWKFTPQRKYEIDHLTLVADESASASVPPGSARLSLYLIPTRYPVALWKRLTENYAEVFRWVPYATYTWVSVKITALSIVGQLIACSLVAFAFARLKFPGRDVLFILMLATMMLPPQVTMIPQFVLFSWLGLYNTLVPLVIFSFVGAPFFIFLMRQFYKTIPQDLTDAAKIDGCGYFMIYSRIMLPLVKPALAAIAIFQFQNSWNEFMQPLIYITDEDKTPISLGLFLFRQTQVVGGGQWAELMAASAVMTLPIIILFFFTQRYFIQGITLTGLKG